MRKSVMMEMLACPMDKHHPLELYEIDGNNNDIILEGALYCTECTRFYPIIESIPVMLPDDLRDRKQEMGFLERHAESLPDKITSSAKPWHL